MLTSKKHISDLTIEDTDDRLTDGIREVKITDDTDGLKLYISRNWFKLEGIAVDVKLLEMVKAVITDFLNKKEKK